MAVDPTTVLHVKLQNTALPLSLFIYGVLSKAETGDLLPVQAPPVLPSFFSLPPRLR